MITETDVMRDNENKRESNNEKFFEVIGNTIAGTKEK